MNRVFHRVFTVMAAISIANIASAQGYKVMNTFHIASPGGWDYVAVNPLNDNIYVSHATQVNILTSKGDSAGVIPNTDGVHGIAFAPEFKKGFTSNGKLNNVSVFDIRTNAVVAQIKTGEKPDAIMYDPATKKVYVCNGKTHDLTVIDAKTNEVVKTVALGGKPETAVTDGAGKIYINIEDKNEIVVVNTKSWKVENHWKVGKGDEPTGLAIDTKTKRLFAGCGNRLMVVLNAMNGEVVKEMPIGEGCDGVAFDAAEKMIFCANGEGTLTVINEKSAKEFRAYATVPTKKGARTLAINEKTHDIYLPTADIGEPVAGEKRPPMIPGTFQVLVVGRPKINFSK